MAQVEPVPAFNLALPPDSSNHGDPHLLCTPATWFNVAAFILANFIAHAASAPPLPGQTTMDQIRNFAEALFFPVIRVMTSIDSIGTGFLLLVIRKESELQKAAVCQALCMVVWIPKHIPIEIYKSVLNIFSKHGFQHVAQ